MEYKSRIMKDKYMWTKVIKRDKMMNELENDKVRRYLPDILLIRIVNAVMRAITPESLNQLGFASLMT